MEFITDLPKSSGYDTILVVIHRLTKMSHFIGCLKDLDGRQFANLFMKEIVTLHALPPDIITAKGDTIHLIAMERNYGEIRNITETQAAFPFTNRWTDRMEQHHIGTIPPSIDQLSTRRLVWLPTTGRICIQQRISGDHQKHTLLCKLPNPPRIRDDRSFDSRKTNETRRNDYFA